MYWPLFGVFTALAAVGAGPVQAQDAQDSEAIKWRVNRDTVGIVSSGTSGPKIGIAADLAAVLDRSSSLRIIPMIGKGPVQSITDIRYLRGTDIGIVQSDVLAYVRSSGLHDEVDQRISYIARLFDEELHVLAGDGVTSLQDLAGRKVGFGPAGGGTFVTASIVFDALRIKVEPVALDDAHAIEKLRSGEIAASVHLAERPFGSLAGLTSGDGVQLLPVALGPELQDIYEASALTAEDYPGLIEPGSTIDTISVAAVMAVSDWQPGTWRYEKVERFVDAFCGEFDELREGEHHKAWDEIDLSAELDGWKRFPRATELLGRSSPASDDAALAAFNRFLDENGGADLSEERKADLYQRYLKWRKADGAS